MAVAKETVGLSELEKEFHCTKICRLCQKTLNSPKILVCFHSFCRHCLNEHTRRNLQSGTTPNCPTCRTDFLIQVKKVAALPTNEFIGSIITSADALSSSQHATDFQRYIPDKTQPITFCETHKKSFDRYCSNCANIMCQLCIGTRHRYHRVITVELAVKELQQMINSYAIGLESCQAFYRAQHSISETAATMNRTDGTTVKPDSRSRYVITQSPTGKGNMNPFMHPETSTFLDSWKECTHRFRVIITSRELRHHITSIAKELCLYMPHETRCKLHEQESYVQQSQNSPSVKNHAFRREIDNNREWGEKEQLIQQALPKQREWMAKEKRIKATKIEKKSYMEANEQRDLVAGDLLVLKANEKSKTTTGSLADKLQIKTVIGLFPTLKVSQDKLEKEDFQVESKKCCRDKLLQVSPTLVNVNNEYNCDDATAVDLHVVGKFLRCCLEI